MEPVFDLSKFFHVAKRAEQSMPTVLSLTEVHALLDRCAGTAGLIARLLYGTGLRLMEGSGCASRMSMLRVRN